MPLIECTLIKGYSALSRRLVSERITDAACSAIGAGPDFVTVTIKEVDPDNYMCGRVNQPAAKALDQADDIVSAYLTSLGEGDLKTASRFLSNDFEMICPGSIKFKTLEEFIEWTQNLYSKILKTILSTNVSFCGLDSTVFCHGPLAGTWKNGDAFSDVRFIDRFDVSEGVINSHEIWNDLTL
jgi:phenylpyruvate tautomerase PptA (4-oxalocrotonate tautomerase family)